MFPPRLVSWLEPTHFVDGGPTPQENDVKRLD